MDQIAASAEISRATIYQHFAGKPPLLEALLVEDWEGQVTLFARLINESRPHQAMAINTWLFRVVEGMRRASGSFAIYRYVLGQGERGPALYRAHQDRLAALLREAVVGKASNRDPVRDRVESSMIIAEIDFLGLSALSHWSVTEVEAAVSIITQRIMGMADTA